MRALIAVTTLVLAITASGQAVAQSAAAPTPELAAEFIDTTLGNGVAKVAWLVHSTEFAGLARVESIVTVDCKSRIIQSSDLSSRAILDIDWRTFVGSNNFFNASVEDRWAARIMAKTTGTSWASDEKKDYIGVVVEPGTKEMTDRLIRAFEFYGKSCQPMKDNPF